jgi:HK97 family phage prohead protease
MKQPLWSPPARPRIREALAVTIRKYFAESLVKDASLGPREIRAVISTATQDRQGDVLEPAGCDMAAYRRNPIVLASHNPTLPIGTAEPKIVGNRIEALITFAPAGVSQSADVWCGLAKSGVVSGISVGFSGDEYEPIRSTGGARFTRWTLLEISLVAVPANSEALIIERSHRPKSKDAAIGAGEVDPIAALAATLTGARKSLASGCAAHASTELELHEITAQLAACQGLVETLLTANAQSERSSAPGIALATRIGRRKSKLDKLDRAPVGAVLNPIAPTREIGGAFLTAAVRATWQDTIWDRYK